MNLKEALNYRSHCFICGAPMEMKSLDLAGIHLSLNDEGLTATTGHKKQTVFFGFNGVYQRSYKWLTLYVNPFNLLIECPKCLPNLSQQDDYYVNKYFGVGASTAESVAILNSEDLRNFYTFSLNGEDDQTYCAILESESIKFQMDNTFYHLKTNFKSNETNIIIGSTSKEEVDVYTLCLPAIDLKSVSNINHLIDKIKTYNVFS